MERGPGEPSPRWLKWYFIIGGSIFAVAIITMGIIFAVIGKGNIYDYDDDYYYEEDDYFSVDVELYSGDDTLVIRNHANFIDWDEYEVTVDGYRAYTDTYYSDYWDECIFYCDINIESWTYYEVRIYNQYSGYMVFDSNVLSPSGYRW